MKLSAFTLISSLVTQKAFGFTTIVHNAAVADRSFSKTALFASRRRQKIASRTEWLEGRAPTVTAPEPGLKTNDEGLEYVELVNADSGATSQIYLLGGVVTSYCDGDGTEFIAVRPDAKLDGSKPISGGLSHCWPQVSLLVPTFCYVITISLLLKLTGQTVSFSYLSLVPAKSNSTVLPEIFLGLSSL